MKRGEVGHTEKEYGAQRHWKCFRAGRRFVGGKASVYKKIPLYEYLEGFNFLMEQTTLLCCRYQCPTKVQLW